MAQPGQGPRQQQILRLLADGTPRTAATIAENLGVSKSLVDAAMVSLKRRRLVEDSGERGRWAAVMWRISGDGRQQIP